MERNLRAKIFISCGQKRDIEEIEVARAIARILEEMGFEPYLAFQEQTLQGLKNNIFSHLTTSEYFLFVDFRREQFANSPEHRGSLFSNQELAIASYLGLEVIAFQQNGVKKLDGMLGSLQLNAIPFENPSEHPEIVRKQMEKVGWRADWKNALKITREPKEYDDAYLLNQLDKTIARFFHIKVENLNFQRIALNCTAYEDKQAEYTRQCV